jgi:hypothetical protein
MQNIQKATVIIVAILLTLLIVAVVLLITSSGKNVIDTSMSQVNNLSNSFYKKLYSDFQNTILSGTEVVATMNKYIGYNINMKVVDPEQGIVKMYNHQNTGEISKDIVSTGRYVSNIRLDNTGKAIKEIVFTRK